MALETPIIQRPLRPLPGALHDRFAYDTSPYKVIAGNPYPTPPIAPVIPQATPAVNRAPQTRPMANVAPPAAAGLIGGDPLGSGLLGASGQIAKASGPSRFPISLGSQVGPALNAFASQYEAAEKAKIQKDRESALVAKYGPEVLLPGAVGPMMTAKAETASRANLANSVKSMFGGGGGEQKGDLGFVMTPDRKQILTFAAQKGPKAISDAIADFRKVDNNLVADARNRLKDPIDLFRKTQTKIDKVNRSVVLKHGTADLAAINSFQRLIDDGVVRGEDIALQGSTQSLVGQLALWAKNKKEGDLLDDTIRKRMATVANQLGESVYSTFRETVRYEKELAAQNNVPWGRVFGKSYDKYLGGAIGKKQNPDKGRFRR